MGIYLDAGALMTESGAGAMESEIGEPANGAVTGQTEAAGGHALGLVVGTTPATPLQFSVGLAPGQYAQLDDVVTTERLVPGAAGADGRVRISGVVTNVEA